MDGITKVFLPLNAETCDFSGSLEQVASMLFANTKGLVYKPSSGISTGYSADKVRLTRMGNLFLTTFTTSILALLSKTRLRWVTFAYRSFTRRLGSVNLYRFRLLEHNSDWRSL